ncbi:aminopeptidase N [Alkanindiges sp. WGS2144]|uniref:aminopeptidase N n=1 Tax=Alkanindiges sp. WGS2144 TaxID=3366808 RepID=UPI00375161D7
MNTAVNPELTEDNHQTIYLKDYTPPSFQVDSIDLTIQVFDDHSLVHSKLVMHRQYAGDLVLFGRDLELLNISLNGQVLTTHDYELDTEQLIVKNAPDLCDFAISVRIHPETNTQLEGLYQAGNLFVTQNEPEGFRKITFYPDRPDVLSVFTTRIEADKKFPTLLANGNLIEKGDLNDNRHYAIWHDPTKKPSYLFAAVIGDLAVLKDSFTTMEGRKVALEIYALADDLSKCHIGMQALKDSMIWDEQNYGRAYDLDNYMIVAVSQFNMGAMENKGLNIFNTVCVLADPETTTDPAIFYVKSTIAHEYFHNWTGNRITCRDWFQLCLKEGFTVFRDQSFSATLQSSAVQRIDDVSSLKTIQFAEDAGPLSHPPRPDHFVEINNFYTATVYDKGAEIARMMANLLGPEKFRQGTDEYFRRHDGQAVTVEDLIDSLSAGSGVDLHNFLPWYSQPGTPCVKGKGSYDVVSKTYTLTLSQSTPRRPNYPEPQALPIPVAVALFDLQTGEQLTLHSTALQQNNLKDGMFLLDQAEQTIVFEQVDAEPVVSLLRDFSAPVLLDFSYSDEDLAFLLEYETNGFNQWQAAQLLLERVLLQGHDSRVYLQAIAQALPKVAQTDALLASRLLEVPTESFMASRIEQQFDPVKVHHIREAILDAIAQQLKNYWSQAYQALPIVPYVDNSIEMGKRAYRNMVLAFAVRAGVAGALDWASTQYEQAMCMTERIAALRQLLWHNAPDANQKLEDFYNRFNQVPLALDLWFGVQAGNPHGSADLARQLFQHPDFDWGTPNRIRAVTGNFAQNPSLVWTSEGMRFYADLAQQLDQKNSILGSRMLQTLSRWYTLVEPLRSEAKTILENLKPNVSSSSVCETLTSLLKAG